MNVDGGPTEDAGSDAPSTPDASPPSDGGSPAKCPPSAPSGACSDDGLECEYGSNPSPDCNLLFRCTGGTWADLNGGNGCPPQSACPGTYASVPVGQTCSPEGVACGYTEGTCTCAHGSPVQQSATWHCFPAQAGCPSPRPNLGTPCEAPASTTCNYGACNDGVALQCQGGVWREVETPCPG